MKPFRLALIGCSATKLGRRAAARDLYQGGLFRLALAAAEKWAEEVLILSARHHVVTLDEALEPYDGRLPNQRELLAGWGRSVGEKLAAALGVAQDDVEACERVSTRVLALAPRSYLEAIDFPRKDAWRQPLRGLGIGQQRAKLVELRRQGPPVEASKEEDAADLLARPTDGASPANSDAAVLLARLAQAPSLASLILTLDGACPGDGEMLLPADVWQAVLARARAEAVAVEVAP